MTIAAPVSPVTVPTPATGVQPQKTAAPPSPSPAAPPVVQAPVAPTQEDLLKRVATAKKAEVKPAADAPIYNSDDLKNIKTADEAQRFLEDKIKHLERGYNEKFMKVADEKKRLETLQTELARQQDWTPERISQLLQDQKFVQAAQAVAQSKAPQTWQGTQDEWSALSDSDKVRFSGLESKVSALQSHNQQIMLNQIHDKIKGEYPDYEPEKIRELERDINTGKLNDESLYRMMWQALNYKTHIENAYRFGLEDRDNSLKEKMNGSTGSIGSGSPGVTSPDKPVRGEGEKPSSFFVRLAQWNLKNNRPAR